MCTTWSLAWILPRTMPNAESQPIVHDLQRPCQTLSCPMHAHLRHENLKDHMYTLRHQAAARMCMTLNIGMTGYLMQSCASSAAMAWRVCTYPRSSTDFILVWAVNKMQRWSQPAVCNCCSATDGVRGTSCG